MTGVVRSVERAAEALHGAWRRLRAWRRIRFTVPGLVFTVGAFAVGFAAINTGNNLLYLLLGAMLGIVALSGWLSEQAIRGLRVRRRTPRGTPVGREVRIHYHVRNRKRRIPSFALHVGEEGLEERAFVARIPAGGFADARSVHRFVRRGVYPLDSVTVSTTFPFGLFLKERDLPLRGELVIWPRADRPSRPPEPRGGRRRRRGLVPSRSAGPRGEYRSLREYRPGDDPGDIHWRRSAGRRVPVVREYDAEGAEEFWICLDTGTEPGEAAEGLVEVAASLAARSSAGNRRFGLAAGGRVVPPGSGPAHLEAVFDVLARVDFRPGDEPPAPPADLLRCVLVTATGRGAERYGDVYRGHDAPAGGSPVGPRRSAGPRLAS